MGNELKQSSTHHMSSQKQFSQLGNKENWDVLLVQGSHMLLSSPGRKAMPWKFRSVGLHGTPPVLEELYSEHGSVSGFGQMGWSWLSAAAYSIYHSLNTHRVAVSYFSNSISHRLSLSLLGNPSGVLLYGPVQW